MKTPLEILHLEHENTNPALIQDELDAEGIQHRMTTARTRDDFVAALSGGHIDLVLADDANHAVSAAEWPRLAGEGHAAVPFVVLADSAKEETAIQSVKAGATDYVVKNRLSRLAPVVRRAVQEAENRSERERLGDQMVQSQKMEILGQLAGGVAHDFNNILAVIMGYSDILVSKLPPDQAMQQHAVEIRNAAELGAGLTRQLLIFSRKQILQNVVVNLNEVVRDLQKILRQLLSAKIEMTFSLDESLGRIMGDPAHASQIIMNLVVNARDAMLHGGRLTIKTCNVVIGGDYGRLHSLPSGEYVMLSVSDTGSGMTDVVKAKIFQPFFTTKEKGKGTGLGLATCQSIVKQHGGHIDLETQLGRGTSFKIYFPRVHNLEQPRTRTPGDAEMPSGTETVLLVEDQAAVRNLACSVLESRGYTVLSACNGREGLRMASEHEGPPIRLVVTDVVMPQMGGKLMAEWLKSLYPEIQVIFTSGYTDDAIAHEGVLDPSVDFLPKPYTPTSLTQMVREVLDRVQSDSPLA